jgi:hypothetical protein
MAKTDKVPLGFHIIANNYKADMSMLYQNWCKEKDRKKCQKARKCLRYPIHTLGECKHRCLDTESGLIVVAKKK